MIDKDPPVFSDSTLILIYVSAAIGWICIIAGIIILIVKYENNMAGIDNIYGNKAQYVEFHSWCTKHCPEALKHFYWAVDEWDNRDSEDVLVLTNLPVVIDNWLLKNCPIDWVVARIKEQYNLEK